MIQDKKEKRKKKMKRKKDKKKKDVGVSSFPRTSPRHFLLPGCALSSYTPYHPLSFFGRNKSTMSGLWSRLIFHKSVLILLQEEWASAARDSWSINPMGHLNKPYTHFLTLTSMASSFM